MSKGFLNAARSAALTAGALCGALAPVSARAQSADLTSAVVPQNLHIYSENGNAYVDMGPAGCSQGRYYLSRSHVGFESIFSLLTAAQLSGRKAVVRFAGCTDHASPQGKIIGAYLK